MFSVPTSGIVASATSAALASLVLAGLFWRRRADASVFFTIYLLSAVLDHGLVLIAPQRFWNWNYELVGDATQALLRVLVPFEMAFKTYRSLPEGYRRIRRIMLIIVITVAAMVWAYPGGPLVNAYHWTLVCARASYGTGFLLLAYLAFSRYHRVPLDPVFRDVAVGFTYLTALAAFTDVLGRVDVAIGWGRDRLVAVSYPLLLAWWASRMWAPEEPTGLSLEGMKLLQPWRVKRFKWMA